ncbi:CadD family cadmium resistance transporter [Fundicoccus sp. Sow4_H7]|uniref:CadD family cadmium resistance transporter n=1 Tax=Fundicoccus sp. Sow4_H7 TaxID=3438784 RepID=UPI003F90EA49
MGQLILSAIGVYISTSIDYVVILIILFAQVKHHRLKQHIYLGQYIGTAILFIVSLVAASILNFVPEDWMIGLLGLVPIYLGIRFIVVGEDDDEDEEVMERLEERSPNRLFLTVALLTIASGGDNLGIYIPYLAGLSLVEVLVVAGVFAIGVIILCEISERFAFIPTIQNTIEKYERIIVPVVFILLGLYILWENESIQYLIGLLR